ncbi:MAG TPA: GAF domain-containing sensor histidine kinase [Ktedonobacteraceae bacterium]|nr:GAF domain-containing sensor histidine kinase [Ktedonobacteraceae bacterium]
MDTRNRQTTQQLLADIYRHYSFIPPIFLALQTVPDMLHTLWQQIHTGYILNPLPYLFKEKLFLALSYHSHSPYDLRFHGITLHRLGLQEQDILTFLRRPLCPPTEIEQHLLVLHTYVPLIDWPSSDEYLEHILLSCSLHLFLDTEHAERCRKELQRVLGTHYLSLSGIFSTIKLYHHWVENLQGRLSVNDETFIPQQFAQHFAAGTALEQLFQAHYTHCLHERLTKDQQKQMAALETQQDKQRIDRSLKALLALTEILILGSEETSPEDGEAWTTHALLKHMLDLTQDILGCKHISVMTTNTASNLLQPVAILGFSRRQEQNWWRYIPDTSLLDQLHDPQLVERAKHGEVLVLDKHYPSSQILPTPDDACSWLVAPMMLDAQLVGLLSLDYGTTHEHHYTEEEIHGASTLSRLFALTLEREQLSQARAETQAREIALTEANERMAEFLSLAGHELKTPLTSIKGNIQLLQRRMEHEQAASMAMTEAHTASDVQSILQRANHQVDRLTRLVRDVIEASRIRSQHLKMHMMPCDLAQLVQSALYQQQLQTPLRTLSLILPPRAVPVSVDRDYIEQVITNYLSNALKYSASDKPIKVALVVKDTRACVSVQDEGPGIAAEEQELIWESFYQAKGNAVRNGSGIGFGLGLFISRSIIEEHGGQVGMHSTPDEKGSTFWFSLPVSNPERGLEPTAT